MRFYPGRGAEGGLYCELPHGIGLFEEFFPFASNSVETPNGIQVNSRMGIRIAVASYFLFD